MAARPRRRRPGRSGGRGRTPGRRASRLLIVVGALALVAIFFLLAGRRSEPGRSGEVARAPQPPPVARVPAPSAAPPRVAVRPTPPAPVRPPALPRLPPPAKTAASPRNPAQVAPAAPLPAAPRAAAPRAAILIDDLGQTIRHLHETADLGTPVSIAVLPGLDATESTAREAAARGIEVLLHLPMEPRPEAGKDPGPGALLTSMTPEAMRAALRDALAAVPGAAGVNNHMGSLFTADPAALAVLMPELKRLGLFWLDSRTGADSRGFEVAQAHGVRSAARDVFLDATVDEEFVRSQLRKLVEIARRRGTAIGIGHPHPETLAALRAMRGELAASGVAWVPVSALLHDGAAKLAAGR